MAGQGRHSEYTPEIGDRICELVSTNMIGTNKLSKLYDWMPSNETIYKWRWQHKDFAEKYALSKMRQAQLTAENLQELCEVETYIDEKGVERIDPGRMALQRLKVDTAKWEASKLAPKVYGDVRPHEQSNPQETLQKIQALVADLNKTNASDI